MKIYTKASSDVYDRVAHLIRLFRPDLLDAGLKVDLLFISTDDENDEEPPLKLNGYPCYAVVRVVDVKGRTMGRGDAEIVIDEAQYLVMNDPKRDALLDHELHHIELVLTPKGRVKLDCRKRPQLTMRKHDRQYGWFDAIAQRHGINSIEVQQAQSLVLAGTQIYFGFMDSVPKLKK